MRRPARSNRNATLVRLSYGLMELVTLGPRRRTRLCVPSALSTLCYSLRRLYGSIIQRSSVENDISLEKCPCVGVQRMRNHLSHVLVPVLLGLGLLALSGVPVVAEAPPVRVMSFNIRYGTAPDGENHWDRRKEFLVETILAFQPDLLGTQETLAFQRDYLAEKLPGYGVLGVGREDGKDQGEIMAIYWRKDRFDVLESGHFWLSTTPDVPGSKSWDSALPRMVTWVKLRDRKAPNLRPILWFNTHFDHRGEQARQESARLLRKKLLTMGEDCSLIVTGDFNAAEGSRPYQLLFGDTEGQPSPIVDSFRAAHPERGEEEGTFSGFRAENTKGARIDWIGCSRDWKVLEAGIDRTARQGRTPSDHFPVFAILTR